MQVDFSAQFQGSAWAGPTAAELAQAKMFAEACFHTGTAYKKLLSYRETCHRAVVALNFVQASYNEKGAQHG
jgi:hypothetical protein